MRLVEVTALNTLLDGDDADNAVDNITGFFDIHNGTDARAINDLADLNNQIDNSIVTRDIAAVDDTAHTVSLTQAEVDRLGEGSVQIEATQTDAVGNLHEGGAATNSFVIDTIDPFVDTIADDQSGIAFDGANTVEYTLTFSEAVQSVTEGDLTVSGAESFSVAHTADTDTAYVTVTVADDSMDNVSITVNDSIVDIAGNPLIEAVDNLQTVDTVNPEVTIADDQSGIAFDGANTVEYTLTFSEAVQSVTEGDLTVSGAESFSVAHTADTDTAYVTVTVADDSMDNVSITVNDSIVDIAGNPLIEAVDMTVQDVDTVNPTASYSSEIKSQNTNGTDDVSSDDDSVVAYTVDLL